MRRRRQDSIFGSWALLIFAVALCAVEVTLAVQTHLFVEQIVGSR